MINTGSDIANSSVLQWWPSVSTQIPRGRSCHVLIPSHLTGPTGTTTTGSRLTLSIVLSGFWKGDSESCIQNNGQLENKWRRTQFGATLAWLFLWFYSVIRFCVGLWQELNTQRITAQRGVFFIYSGLFLPDGTYFRSETLPNFLEIFQCLKRRQDTVICVYINTGLFSSKYMRDYCGQNWGLKSDICFQKVLVLLKQLFPDKRQPYEITFKFKIQSIPCLTKRTQCCKLGGQHFICEHVWMLHEELNPTPEVDRHVCLHVYTRSQEVCNTQSSAH